LTDECVLNNNARRLEQVLVTV